MIEQVYNFQETDRKTIERIVDDQNVNLNHVVLGRNESLPDHFSNSHVYLIIVRGGLAVKLGDQEVKMYPSGTILSIPYDTKMAIKNEKKEPLEFFIVKAPPPEKKNA